MIVHLRNFIARERPAIDELDALLHRLEQDPALVLTVPEIERLDYLYHRVASALSKLSTLPATEDVRVQLAAVVARAYAELHDNRSIQRTFRPLRWFLRGFPSALRRHIGPLWLAIVVTVTGASFGAYGVSTNEPDVKDILMPFSHLQGTPSERVKHEEHGGSRALDAHHSQFAAQLMVNNIRVSIMAMAFGAFFGLGTLILLFYNGVILGAVVFDYVHAGQLKFLAGWLLPHGSIEIPAILIAGQAGIVLGTALLGWRDDTNLPQRLRRVAPDLVSLMGGVAIMLIWAGLIESFLSQYHQPVVPYAAKIALGVAELVALISLLATGGRARVEPAQRSPAWIRLGKSSRKHQRARVQS